MYWPPFSGRLLVLIHPFRHGIQRPPDSRLQTPDSRLIQTTEFIDFQTRSNHEMANPIWHPYQIGGILFYISAPQSSPPIVWYQPPTVLGHGGHVGHGDRRDHGDHRGYYPLPLYRQFGPVVHNAQLPQPDYQVHQRQQQHAAIQAPAQIIPQPADVHNGTPQRYVFALDDNQITLTQDEIAIDAMLREHAEASARLRAGNVDGNTVRCWGYDMVRPR